MDLPKIELPIYELKLPSSGKLIKVRPFIVKEEKLLLMAVESKDNNEIINTTKQIISNCILEGNVNVNTLPFFDIDYLFIALRAKSIGEKIPIQYRCTTIMPDNEECGAFFDSEIDISNVEIETNNQVSDEINLDSGVTVKMKYPTYSIMKNLSAKDPALTNKIKVISHCIDMIVKGKRVHSSRDLSEGELLGFIESLTQKNFKKLEEFVDNFPSFYIGVQHKCENCGTEHSLRYTDFLDFFQ